MRRVDIGVIIFPRTEQGARKGLCHEGTPVALIEHVRERLVEGSLADNVRHFQQFAASRVACQPIKERLQAVAGKSAPDQRSAGKTMDVLPERLICQPKAVKRAASLQ